MLTSSLLLNLFYKDLIDKLENKDGGIGIKVVKFNVHVFCYADDIFLAYTTATGLQCLIDNLYVTKWGLGSKCFHCKPILQYHNVTWKCSRLY